MEEVSKDQTPDLEVVPRHPLKKRNAILIRLAAIAGAGLGCIAFVFGISLYRDFTDAASARLVGRRFILFMKDHDYKSAHSLLTPNAQIAYPPPALRTIELRAEGINGKFIACRPTDWKIAQDRRKRVVQVNFLARYTRTSAPISLATAKNRNGAYRIWGFNYVNN